MFYTGFDAFFSILFPLVFLVVLGMILFTVVRTCAHGAKIMRPRALPSRLLWWPSGRTFPAIIRTIRCRIRSLPIMPPFR
mgnify:CR=1 FL=1